MAAQKTKTHQTKGRKMTSETTLASLNVLAEKCDDVRSPRYKFYRELRSLIESQQRQNERLVKALEAIVDADRRGELHRDPLDTDDLFKEAKALLPKLKPATNSTASQ